MIIRTTCKINAAAEEVWPLLCDSQMKPESSLLFKLGVPQPQKCKLPDGDGGVGKMRQCISDRGVIEQEILEWEPPTRLSFRMEYTDLYFKNDVDSILETFEIQSLGEMKSRLTRITQIEVGGKFQMFKRGLFFLGLKKVHRFVFRNWKQICLQNKTRKEGAGVG